MADQPRLRILSTQMVDQVISEAFDILETLGVFVENKNALQLFEEIGIAPDRRGRIRIPTDVVQRCVDSAPSEVRLFDRSGKPAVALRNDELCFDPGSAALNILDYGATEARPPVSRDYVKYVSITEQLENIGAQSTAMICSDVPQAISDSYRLFLSLLHCHKPIVTGTFDQRSFAVMLELLTAVRGSREALAEKPLAIFDACPSPPLRWSDLTCQAVIDAARAAIPSEIISMPMMAANAPASIFSTVTQHCAETLSGVVIGQLARRGAPVIWGGSPSVFDVRKGTTPMGAIETMMIDSAYSQTGKKLGFPTHAYMGLSDAKILDYQAGFESGMGSLMAALSGINMISGPGMLDFESCFSLEKLVLDNEICGMCLRLSRGIQPYEELVTKDLLEEYEARKQLLSHPTTRRLFRREFYLSGAVVDRATRAEWAKDKKTAEDRAHEQINRMLREPNGALMDEQTKKELQSIMSAAAAQAGLGQLPEISSPLAADS